MLNLDSRTRRKLVWTATIMAPVLAVQVVRLGFGASIAPASAAAAGASSAPAGPAIVPEKPLTDDQKRAQAWLLSRTRTLQCRSPMDRPDPPAPADPPVGVRPAPTDATPPTTPAPAPPPTLTLSAMISSNAAGQPIVIINHRPYRTGDALTAMWRVKHIDTKRRVVTIQGPDDRCVDLTPETPSGDR